MLLFHQVYGFKEQFVYFSLLWSTLTGLFVLTEIQAVLSLADQWRFFLLLPHSFCNTSGHTTMACPVIYLLWDSAPKLLGVANVQWFREKKFSLQNFFTETQIDLWILFRQWSYHSQRSRAWKKHFILWRKNLLDFRFSTSSSLRSEFVHKCIIHTGPCDGCYLFRFLKRWHCLTQIADNKARFTEEHTNFMLFIAFEQFSLPVSASKFILFALNTFRKFLISLKS